MFFLECSCSRSSPVLFSIMNIAVRASLKKRELDTGAGVTHSFRARAIGGWCCATALLLLSVSLHSSSHPRVQRLTFNIQSPRLLVAALPPVYHGVDRLQLSTSIFPQFTDVPSPPPVRSSPFSLRNSKFLIDDLFKFRGFEQDVQSRRGPERQDCVRTR